MATNNYIKIILFVFVLVFSPSCSWASGGGPLILIFNGSVFIVGQIWIVGVEFIIYRRLLVSSKQHAFGDVLVVNLLSTIAIAFILASIIAAGGLVGSFLPGDTGALISALGSWVYDNAKYGRLAVYMSLFWFIFLSVVTVYFESWVYKRRWRKRGFAPNVSSTTLSWCANAVSHIGLFVAVLVIWHELIL